MGDVEDADNQSDDDGSKEDDIFELDEKPLPIINRKAKKLEDKATGKMS